VRLWWGVAACAATIAVACGEPAAPSVLRGQPGAYLLTIDQMVSPDFTVDARPHALSAQDIAGADQSRSRQLGAAGLLAAAGEDLFRPTGTLADANGPLQVDDTVEQFSSAAGAAAVYAADVGRFDVLPGASAISTGSLGDAAHAITRTATAPSGTTAVEITVEWRVDNVVNVLVVRGREGGTRPDDAFLLAHRQTATELGLATPRPS
jgi:hypothetical protein